MIIKGIEYKDYIETNIGNIPLEDYLDIMAHQHGFYDYDEMYKNGYRLKGYENLSPNDISEYKEHDTRGDFKPIENDNIIYVQSTDNTNNVDYGNDNTSYISNKTLSSYHKEFIEYCKGKVKDLPLSNFLLGKKYPTLMLCSINGQDNNAIVFVKGHENELCWRDSYKGTLNFIQNSAPDIYAVDMKFDAIDTKYYDSLNKYWDDLRLDEIMEINNNRLNVIDSYNDKEM